MQIIGIEKNCFVESVMTIFLRDMLNLILILRLSICYEKAQLNVAQIFLYVLSPV